MAYFKKANIHHLNNPNEYHHYCYFIANVFIFAKSVEYRAATTHPLNVR